MAHNFCLVSTHNFVDNKLEVPIAVQENILVLHRLGAYIQYSLGYLGGTSTNLEFSRRHQYWGIDWWIATRRIFFHDIRHDVGIYSCFAFEKIF